MPPTYITGQGILFKVRIVFNKHQNVANYLWKIAVKLIKAWIQTSSEGKIEPGKSINLSFLDGRKAMV